VLSALDSKYLVLIDNLPAERARTAGRSEAAQRLAPETWRAFMATLHELASIARDEYGLSPVIHPHVGGYLEFEDEIDAALADLPEELVGLCIDTGHSAYAGVDPIALYRRTAGRVRYLHFKNIDQARHRLALERQLDLFAAISEGVFCPLPNGVVDFRAFRQALEEHGYRGYATVEQDSDPRTGALPAKDAVASLTFLERIGIAESASTPASDQI
jgi:inosose dehydratase